MATKKKANTGDTITPPEVEKAPTVAQKAALPIPMVSPIHGKWHVSASFQNHKDRTPPSVNPGTDIAVPVGTGVYAAHDGVITVADHIDDSSGGKWIEVTGAKGIKTQYLHLSKVAVKKGQRVAKGSLIGKSGNTGASTGPHLHFVIKLNGKNVDPDKYL